MTETSSTKYPATDQTPHADIPAHFDPVSYINTPRWQDSRLGLERIRALLSRMSNPEKKLKFVHVAGTNGKGTTCAYLSHMLTHAKLRCGLFTSPFIMRFEERIQVNNRLIPEKDLREITWFVKQHAESLARQTGEHATEFELMCAVAFEYFARCNCDIVMCEVGLGGRLDSTNVIEAPEVCVITRLGFDHTDLLGETLEDIAREKAAIIKPGGDVVSWPHEDPAVQKIIHKTAQENGCTLTISDFSQLKIQEITNNKRHFTYQNRAYTTQLLAPYQISNAVMAIEAARCLIKRGWALSEDDISCGIEQASWPGRFELISHTKPAVLIDGAHNPQGACALAAALREVFPRLRFIFLVSVLADKDYPHIIEPLIPLASAFVCATPPNPRSLPAHELAGEIRKQASDLPVYDADTIDEAYRRACALAQDTPCQSLICACGSLYSIAEMKKLLEPSAKTKSQN